MGRQRICGQKSDGDGGGEVKDRSGGEWSALTTTLQMDYRAKRHKTGLLGGDYSPLHRPSQSVVKRC